MNLFIDIDYSISHKAQISSGSLLKANQEIPSSSVEAKEASKNLSHLNRAKKYHWKES